MIENIFTIVCTICMILLAISVFTDILVHRLEIKRIKMQIKYLIEEREKLKNDSSSKV